MHFLYLIAVILIPSILNAQVKVNLPEDWIELETPTELPPRVIYLRKASSEDQAIQLSVAAMNPVDTLSEAEEVVAGQISGMKKGGFILESVTDVEINGFPAKHLVGEFRSDGYEGAYLADSKVIFSDEATVLISVSVDDARGGRELGTSSFNWVTVSGSPAVLADKPSISIAERIGYYGVWMIVGVAVIGVIRRGIQRRKSKKGEQGGAGNPAKPGA